MFLPHAAVRGHLRTVLADKARQGHAVDGLEEELRALPDSYDALHAFAGRLAELPLREDWPYREPSDLPGILAECDPGRPRGPWRPLDSRDVARRVEAAFLASACGCILGKPIESVTPTLTLHEIREALGPVGSGPCGTTSRRGRPTPSAARPTPTGRAPSARTSASSRRTTT